MVEFFPVSWIDLLIILFVALGAYVGSLIGTVCAIFYILGGLFGSAAAARLALPVGLMITSGPGAPFIGYMIVFVLVAVLLSVFGIYLSCWLEEYFLGLYDRFIGAMLGILLSFVLAASLTLSWMIQPNPSFQERMSRSVLVPPLLRFVGGTLKVLPPHLMEQIQLIQVSQSEKVQTSAP